MAQTEYKLTIDDSDVEESLIMADRGFDKMQKSGDEAMKSLGKSATKLGDTLKRDVNGRLRDARGRFVAMDKTGDSALKKITQNATGLGKVISGAVTPAFTSLAGAALQFGQVAVSAFAQVIQSSVQAANEFDVTRKKFISIFDGGEKEADAVMDHISKRASALGLDMNEALSLSKSFLPDVKGSEDPLGAIDNLLIGVRALAEEDPLQGMIGARVAIDEAMSGSLQSLKDRFEFTKTEIDILKAAQGELGQVAGTIEGINQVMQRRGFDIEALKGTFTQAVGEMTFATSKLQIELGKPIADQLTESLNDLNNLVNENSDDLQLLAGSIGDVVANVVDFISTEAVEWLAQIDVGNIQEVVDAFNRMVTQIQVINDLLPGMEMDSEFLDSVTWIIDQITKAVEVFTKLDAIIDILGESGKGLGGAIIGAFKEEGGTFGERFTNSLITIVKGNEKAKESFLASADAIEKGNQKMKEQEETIKTRKAALDVDTSAGLKRAEAFLKEGDAASKAQSELEKLGLSEKQITQIHKDAASVLERRNTLETKFSQDRADNHRQALEDIDDIEADHKQDILAAGVNLNRSTRGMATKHGQERTDVEKGFRRELLDVEQEYQDELTRIQRQTQLSMESAELSQDALAFVEALRQQEVAEEEASIRRDEGMSEAETGREQQLADLEVSQAAERETLQQSHRDKLEDLQLSLEQELAEQRLVDDRRAEQQALDEQRQFDALTQGQANKLDKLTEGLDAETAAVVRAEAAKLAAVESFAAQAQAKLNQLAVKAAATVSTPVNRGADLASRVASRSAQIDVARRQASLQQRGGVPRRLGGGVTAGISYRVGEIGIEGYLPRRQFGGTALGGQPMLLGELGEELFVPPVSGSIIPNNQIGQFLGGNGVTNNNSTEINFQPQFQLSNPAVLSPAQAAQTQAIAASVASQMLQQVLGGSR